MKGSDIVARELVRAGIKRVFCISGGASLHMIHSLAHTEGIDYLCPQHEQSCGFAADAYARLTGLGACVVTSGPGATNLLTAIASSYYDSVPVVYITGQQTTERLRQGAEVRQYGFQATPIVDMALPVTKYAVQVTDASRLSYELQKGIDIATTGRKGPVLIDIPDDIQRADVVDEIPYKSMASSYVQTLDLSHQIPGIFGELNWCKRPVLVFGWGVRLAGAERQAHELARLLDIPVAVTWGARDLFHHDHKNLIGAFGTHGNRAANFAIQNADLIITVGTRLDTKSTGTPPHWFSRSSKKVMVDIDCAEIDKFRALGVHIDHPVCADAKEFLSMAVSYVDAFHGHDGSFASFTAWGDMCNRWRQKYTNEASIPYEFMEQLSSRTPADEVVVTDTGCALAWAMQAFAFRGQRFIHALNNTPMGYGLPAAIGAASTGKQVTLITGDGSIMMSIGELATIAKHKLPIRIFLLNNGGHAMCRQTENQWLGGQHHGTDLADLAFPDFHEVFRAFGISATVVDIPHGARVSPQSRYGKPNEDQDPPLSRHELEQEMLIPLVA